MRKVGTDKALECEKIKPNILTELCSSGYKSLAQRTH